MDQEMVQLEQTPDDAALLGSIFRTIHTVKGTCGFFGFTRLEAVSHATEHILNELRNGKRRLDTSLASVILESMDALKRMLASIEAEQGEGPVFEPELLAKLQSLRETQPDPAPSPAAAVAQAEPAKIPSAPPTVQDHPEAPPPAVPETKGSAPEVPPLAVPETKVTAPEVHPATPLQEEGASGSPQTGVPEAAAAPKAASVADTTLRIGVDLLDRIMNLVGELVLTRNRLLQYSVAQGQPAQDDNPLNNISQRFDLITSELQSEVMKTRMQPISVVWNKLPRVVRDLATALNKSIALEMEGAETELDRTIIEAIKDPLTHIVRNSCDHGIEMPEVRVQQGKSPQGRLLLRAFHEGGKVNIEISDDGAGINAKRVREKAVERGLITAAQAQKLSDQDAIGMVFLPGFSTAAAVTNISGRGVGMDVVKTNIERVGGTINLASRAGEGTKVQVKIPLTLAIIPGLVIRTGGERFVIPQVNLHELIWLDAETARTRIEHVHNTPVYRQRDGLLPLADLSEILDVAPVRPSGELSIAVLQADGHQFGLIVDSVVDTEEIVVKPLGPLFQEVNCYAGATIMGDGAIALILDVHRIGLRSGILQPVRQSVLGSSDQRETAVLSADGRQSMLLFRAGNFTRVALPLAQVARLEQIPRGEVERAAGREVVQYRNDVLPLVSLAELFGGASGQEADLLEVIVCRHGSGTIGLVVDEVLDAVEEKILSAHGGNRPGLLGTAVIGGQVTDILDLEAVVAARIPDVAAESLARLNVAIGAASAPANALEARP